MSRRSVTLALLGGLGLLSGCASGPPPVTGPVAPTVWRQPPVPGPLADAPKPGAARRVEMRLANRLRIVVIEHRRRPVVSARLLLHHGVASEDPAARGSTALAVALLGDLYERDDLGDRIVGEKTLRSQVWYRGGAYQLHVGHDFAGIGIDGYAAELPRYIEMLAEAVRRPRRGEEMFAARRDAMIHALEDIELGDDATLYRVLERAAFGFTHPYARTIEGTQRSLREIGYEQVVWRQQQLLDPRAATLLVVGDVDANQVFGVARRALTAWKGPKKPFAPRPPPALRRPSGKRVRLIEQPRARLMTVCFTSTVLESDISDATLDVLAAELGGGLDSRLSRALRRDVGLVYGVHAQVVRRRHARALLGCTRTPYGSADEALRRVQAVLADAVDRAPPPAELARAQAEAASALRGETASLSGLLQTELVRVLEPDRESRTARRAAIAGVDAGSVRAAARALLGPDRVRFVLAGPRGPAQRAASLTGLGKVQPVASVW